MKLLFCVIAESFDAKLDGSYDLKDVKHIFTIDNEFPPTPHALNFVMGFKLSQRDATQDTKIEIFIIETKTYEIMREEIVLPASPELISFPYTFHLDLPIAMSFSAPSRYIVQIHLDGDKAGETAFEAVIEP